jgi:predicted AlkP superfamily phosphohydrolase/phosphomutase
MWEKIPWDIFMPVFTGSDRLAHFLWEAYENPGHNYFDTFRHFFHELDRGIGMITQKIRSTDELIILSDHGMEKTTVEVNLNYFLKEQGFLNLGSDFNKRYRNIMEGSRAFVLDPARIYLNKKGKYPLGSVSPSEEEPILDELVNEFMGLSWEGKRVIDKIYRRDEIYQGKQVQNGPDLVLIPESGFHLRGKIDRQSIFESPIVAGKHTLDDAFLYVNRGKSSIRVPSHPNVEHIVPLIEDLCLI